MSDTIQRFNNSHGLNLLTANILRRWRGAVASRQRLESYIDFGGGVALPHVEAIVNGERTSRYQISGPVVQGQLGTRYVISPRFTLFAEYKYNRAWLEEQLEGGGTISFQPYLHQVAVGAAVAL